MDSVLKFVQILFYLTAGFVAILTYIKAKSGLLNTINTEYHKKVIDRLSALSEDLFSEFDHESDNYWARYTHFITLTTHCFYQECGI